MFPFFYALKILRTCSYQATGRWRLLHCSSDNLQKSARVGRPGCSSFVFCYWRNKIFKLMLISSSLRLSTTQGTQMAFASTWENPASRWFSKHLGPFSTNNNDRPFFSSIWRLMKFRILPWGLIMKSKLAQFPRRWLKPIVGPFWGARVSPAEFISLPLRYFYQHIHLTQFANHHLLSSPQLWWAQFFTNSTVMRS